MKMSFDSDTATLWVSLPQEIDHHRALDIRFEIDTEIKEKAPNKLILDFTEVSFMDSSGIGLIMGRQKLLRERMGKVVVKSPAPSIKKVMKLAALDRLVSIEDC